MEGKEMPDLEIKKGFKGLAHIGIVVSDIDISKNFYHDILAMEILHENFINDVSGKVKVCFMKMNELVIELIQLPNDTKDRKHGVVDHIAFAVKDICKIKNLLALKGIKYSDQDIILCEHLFSNGAKWINFRGPDKEIIEINEVL
jgi:lactoylglutathione lyase